MIIVSFVLFASLILAWLAAPNRETRTTRRPMIETSPADGTRNQVAELGFQS